MYIYIYIYYYFASYTTSSTIIIGLHDGADDAGEDQHGVELYPSAREAAPPEGEDAEPELHDVGDEEDPLQHRKRGDLYAVEPVAALHANLDAVGEDQEAHHSVEPGAVEQLPHAISGLAHRRDRLHVLHRPVPNGLGVYHIMLSLL